MRPGDMMSSFLSCWHKQGLFGTRALEVKHPENRTRGGGG